MMSYPWVEPVTALKIGDRYRCDMPKPAI